MMEKFYFRLEWIEGYPIVSSLTADEMLASVFSQMVNAE